MCKFKECRVCEFVRVFWCMFLAFHNFKTWIQIQNVSLAWCPRANPRSFPGRPGRPPGAPGAQLADFRCCRVQHLGVRSPGISGPRKAEIVERSSPQPNFSKILILPMFLKCSEKKARLFEFGVFGSPNKTAS